MFRITLVHISRIVFLSGLASVHMFCFLLLSLLVSMIHWFYSLVCPILYVYVVSLLWSLSWFVLNISGFGKKFYFVVVLCSYSRCLVICLHSSLYFVVIVYVQCHVVMACRVLMLCLVTLMATFMLS